MYNTKLQTQYMKTHQCHKNNASKLVLSGQIVYIVTKQSIKFFFLHLSNDSIFKASQRRDSVHHQHPFMYMQEVTPVCLRQCQSQSAVDHIPSFIGLRQKKNNETDSFVSFAFLCHHHREGSIISSLKAVTYAICTYVS